MAGFQIDSISRIAGPGSRPMATESRLTSLIAASRLRTASSRALTSRSSSAWSRCFSTLSGIVGGVGVRVVVAVDRHPLADAYARGEPQHHPEGDVGRSPEPDGPVGDTPVEVHGGADVGEGGHGDAGGEAEKHLDEQSL